VTATKAHIFLDAYDGRYRVDYQPDNTIRDRSHRGYDTRADAEEAIEHRLGLRDYTVTYIGEA
jgi:hypothetical protein